MPRLLQTITAVNSELASIISQTQTIPQFLHINYCILFSEGVN